MLDFSNLNYFLQEEVAKKGNVLLSQWKKESSGKKLFMEAENKTKYSPVPQLPLELAVIEAIVAAN